MRRALLLSLVLVPALAAGCKKDPPVPAAAVDASITGGSASDAAARDAAREEAVRQLVENFRRVHFALDSSTLTADAKAALAANAEILRRYPELQVEVQGHADERGTIDYNIALGQRRAKAVIDHLAGLGVSPGRLLPVSYGEERPLLAGAGERAWSQNRRAEFRVLTASAAVAGTTAN